MTALVAPEPISPELVLVSPPALARMARNLLPDPPAARPAPPVPLRPRRAELVAVWLFCLLVTLGPLAWMIVASPVRG